MEIIRVEEDPIQLFSDVLSNSGLARTGYSHKDDCARMVICHKILAVSRIFQLHQKILLLFAKKGYLF